jgi:cell fate (sporulation/competence/biofilm development) regulator YmcA (YheA/YmcA/DUF963 family)
MKSIGWCLDRIQIVMVSIPKEVTSPEDKAKANLVLDEVREYADTLAQLIQNPKFKKHLQKLEKAPIEGVQLQVHEVEELFKDLEHILQVLDLYFENLEDIIQNHPKQWHSKAKDLIQMIDQKFGGEWGELRKEFKIALRTEKELKQIITSEKHLAEVLK